MKVVSDYN